MALRWLSVLLCTGGEITSRRGEQHKVDKECCCLSVRWDRYRTGRRWISVDVGTRRDGRFSERALCGRGGSDVFGKRAGAVPQTRPASSCLAIRSNSTSHKEEYIHWVRKSRHLVIF